MGGLSPEIDEAITGWQNLTLIRMGALVQTTNSMPTQNQKMNAKGTTLKNMISTMIPEGTEEDLHA